MLTSAVGGEAVFSPAESRGPAVGLAASITSSGGGELAATPSSSGERNCARSAAAEGCVGAPGGRNVLLSSSGAASCSGANVLKLAFRLTPTPLNSCCEWNGIGIDIGRR